jgi:hypothetical protein
VFAKLALAPCLGFLGLLGACSSHDAGTAPSALDVAGVWNQGASLRDTTNNQTHIHTGYFSFARQGEAFTGRGQQSGVCHGPSGDYEGPLATGALFQITDGVQQGAHVSFKTELCTYEGTVSADGAHIDGTMRCAYSDRGVSFVWTGEWLADRQR